MTILGGQAAVEASARSAPSRGGALDREQLTAHYGWVRAVARNLVRDPWGAEDVTQETLLAALAAPPLDVPDDRRLRAWLGRVAFNLSRLGARQASRQRAREVRVARRESLPSVSEELEAAGLVNALSKAIGELAEPYRSAVLMRYYDGLSTAEIAARSSVSELAVRKRLWRARNKLRAALDHGPQRGQRLAALLAWTWVSRGTRAQGLTGLAAGLLACAGATWWSGSGAREGTALVDPALAGPAPAALVASRPAPAAGSVDLPFAPRSGPTSRRTRAPLPEGGRPPRVFEDGEPSTLYVAGVVLDLEGRVRAGLELVDARLPEEILATSDALGGFHLPVHELPLQLEARGPGWTTIVPARFADASEPPARLAAQPLIVAEAADLAARVLDESGRAVAEAQLTLRCEESAFARIELPVRLDSAVLRSFRADLVGRCEERELPRGAGLVLAIHAAGFEPLERDTQELGSEETFVLRALPEARLLAGTVRRQDGRPAAGATVRLAHSSTTADERGRFRLPLRGVHVDSALEAEDPRKAAAPVQLRRFGARLQNGFDGEVDLVLGDEHDPVRGKLMGDRAGGWIVAAYRQRDGTPAEHEDEQPAALAWSDAEGGFEFALPRGAYDLYALASDGLVLVRRAALGTRPGVWRVELPPALALVELHGQVRSSDGRALTAARIEVRVHLDGTDGGRQLVWKRLASDERGQFAFARDPAVELELGLTHAAAEQQAFACSATSASLELVLPRPSFVQVARASERAERCSVLDADGRVLAARGPLRIGEQFALRSGSSPVLEVPSAARWLELEQAGDEPLRVPIQPRAGEVLRVRP